MIIWVDAQFSPEIALWIAENYDAQAVAVRELGFRDSSDRQNFIAAKKEGAVVMTKERKSCYWNRSRTCVSKAL